MLTVYALHLAFIAWRLPLDYWDGYDYLTNARLLAGHDVARFGCGYWNYRPPLVPLLDAVVLKGYAPGGGGTALSGPHLVAACLSVFSIVALYWLVRQAFPPNEAILGGALLAANPLFIHYAPFALTDIPTMLFLTVTAAAYLRARRRGGWFAHALAAASLAAAMLAKYSAAAMLGGLAVFEVLRVLFPGHAAEGPAPGIRRRIWRLLKDVRPWLVLAAALAIFYLVQAAADARAMPGVNTFTHTLGVFGQSVGTPPLSSATDVWYEFVPELTTAFTLPLMVVAVVGMLVGALRRTEVDLLCLAWFGVVFGALTVLIGHKEARYAFPILPPLIYFMVSGVRELWRALVRGARSLIGERARFRRVPELVAAVVLLAFVPKPAAQAGSELLRFYDPVYTRPFLPEVASWVLARTAPGQRVLASRYFAYNMYAANPFFSPYEEFMHFHGIGRCALTYLLDRPVEEIDPLPPVEGDRLEPLVERFATSEVVLTGSKALVGPSPEPPEPMTLTFIERRTLRRVDGGTPDGATYQAVNDPEHRLVLVHKGGGWEVGEGWPGADWRLYQRKAEGGAAEPFGEVASEPPPVLELVKVDQIQRTFR